MNLAISVLCKIFYLIRGDYALLYLLWKVCQVILIKKLVGTDQTKADQYQPGQCLDVLFDDADGLFQSGAKIEKKQKHPILKVVISDFVQWFAAFQPNFL